MLLALCKLVKGPIFGNISRLSTDVLIPIILIPLLLCLASISAYFTCIISILVIALLFYAKRIYLQKNPRTRFFMMWLVSSVFWLFLLFNIVVIGLLEILWEENFILVILGILSVSLIYQTKLRAPHLSLPSRMSYPSNGGLYDNAVIPLTSNGTVGENKFCKYCQTHVDNCDNHSLWIDCCVGTKNNKYFICGVFFGMIALFYGTNLTMTTICHPFIVFKGVLLPDDCSDVYFEFRTAICFVCGTYSLTIAICILFFLLKQLVCGLSGASLVSFDTKITSYK